MSDTLTLGSTGPFYTVVPTSFDKPNVELCKNIVLRDFANRILTLFKENPFGMRKETPHCFIYSAFKHRFTGMTLIGGNEAKLILKLTNFDDNIADFVQQYIEDYMSHNYLGQGVEIPTTRDIVNWCGGGEFPFLHVYLVKYENSNSVYLTYGLCR